MIIDSKIIFDFLLSRLFIEHRAVLSLASCRRRGDFDWQSVFLASAGRNDNQSSRQETEQRRRNLRLGFVLSIAHLIHPYIDINIYIFTDIQAHTERRVNDGIYSNNRMTSLEHICRCVMAFSKANIARAHAALEILSS